MLPISALLPPHIRRSRIHALRTLLVLMSAALASSTTGCRDTRPDADYCGSCTTDADAAGETSASASNEGAIMGGSAVAGDRAQTQPPLGTGVAQSDGTMANVASVPAAGGAAGTITAGTSGTGAAANGGRSSAGASAMSNVGSMSFDAGMRVEAAGGSGNSGNGGRGGSAATRDAGMAPSDPMQPDAQSMPMPCGGACGGETPFCDEAAHSCVQCLQNDQCPADTPICDGEQHRCLRCVPGNQLACPDTAPVCNLQNECVVCSSDFPESCPTAQRICDNEMRCVECLPGLTRDCPPERGQCTPEGACVACTDNTQCTTPQNPRCDMQSYSCTGCAGPNDCAGFVNAQFCDMNSHVCVACTREVEQKQCGPGNFCDANTQTCMRGMPTRPSCERCYNDDECAISPNVAACVLLGDNQSYCVAAAVSGRACEDGYTPQMPPGRTIEYCMPARGTSCQPPDNAETNLGCTMDPGACGLGMRCNPMTRSCVRDCFTDLDCEAPQTCDLTAGICAPPGAGRN